MSDLDRLDRLYFRKYDDQMGGLDEDEEKEFNSLKAKIESQLEEYIKYKPIFDFCHDPDVLVDKVYKNEQLESQITTLTNEKKQLEEMLKNQGIMLSSCQEMLIQSKNLVSEIETLTEGGIFDKQIKEILQKYKESK